MNMQSYQSIIPNYCFRFFLIALFGALPLWCNTAAAFGTDGAVTTDIGGTDLPSAAARDSSGRLIVVGSTSDGSDSDLAIVRYSTDGTLDTTFDDDGIKTLDIGMGSNDYAKAVAIDSTDRICVAGYTDAQGTDDFLLLCLIVEDDGELSLDPDFRAGDGTLVHDISGSTDRANAILLDSSDNIYLGGVSNDNFTIARYNSSGFSDPSFDEMVMMGVDGVVTTDLGGDDNITGLAFNSEGHIIASGYTSILLSYNIALAKYYSSGQLVETFGDGGGYTVDDLEYDGSSYPDAIVDSSDRILVSATRSETTQQYLAARYTSDGTLDTSFGGSDGIFDYDLSSINAGEYGASANLTIDDAGHVLLAGTILSSDSYFNFLLFRLTDAGELDTTFGDGDGIETRDVGFSFDNMSDLILDDSANAILIGTSLNDFALYAVSNATCGNSSIEGSETCDDGNTTSDDGCSSACAIESSDDGSGDSSDAGGSSTTSDTTTDSSDTDTTDSESSDSSSPSSAQGSDSSSASSGSDSPSNPSSDGANSTETSLEGTSNGGGCALTNQRSDTASTKALLLAALAIIIFARLFTKRPPLGQSKCNQKQ